MALTISTTLHEGSTAYVSVVCTNLNGVVITPSTIYYMVYDMTTGETVLDWTAATPGASTTIHLTAVETTLLTGQTAAIRVIRVIATYGIDDQVTAEYLYSVRSLAGADPN